MIICWINQENLEDIEVHGCWGRLNPVCRVSGTHAEGDSAL